MLLLAFAAVLLIAVLVSALAHRTILSTAVVFLLAGIILGPQTTGVLQLDAGSPIVATLAELALFAVLFTPAAHQQPTTTPDHTPTPDQPPLGNRRQHTTVPRHPPVIRRAARRAEVAVSPR